MRGIMAMLCFCCCAHTSALNIPAFRSLLQQRQSVASSAALSVMETLPAAPARINPKVLLKVDPKPEKAGLAEPFATLTKLLYYGAYVGVFGKMLLTVIERGLPGNMPGAG
jgi:hypothetical protein